MHLDFLWPAFFLIALYAPTILAAKPKNAILLSEVQSLTLKAGKTTSHRRVSALPQLKCISPKSICNLHTIDVMRCVNQGAGYDSEDIQWACTASLPPELKLGSTEVICEGYKTPDDPYVLKGSCGVEYRLVLTDAGEQKFPNLGGSGGGERDWSAWLFGIVFVAVLVWIVWSAFAGAQGGPGRQRRPRNNNPRGGGGGGGGPGGGGGGGGWDEPPPPYPGSNNKPSSSQGQGGWQPGFWSGLAGGAAAGYFAGGRGRNDNRRGPDQGYGGYGSNWGAGPSNSRSNSGSGSASTSSSRHESTGFGSTSRR